MKWFSALAAGLLLGAASFAQAADTTAPAANAEPEYEVLVFWGAWCPQCGAVLRDMENVEQAHAGKRVRVTAVNVGAVDGADTALSRKGVEGLHRVHDGSALRDRYDVVGVPWVVVVDRDGKPVATPSRDHRPGEIADWVNMDLSLRL